MGVTVVSWNIAKKHAPWRELVRMGADVALLQEAVPPPEDVDTLDIGPREAWESHSWNSNWWHGRGWKALFDRWPMVVRLSDRVEVEWFKQVSPVWGGEADEIQVSGIGDDNGGARHAEGRLGRAVHCSFDVCAVVGPLNPTATGDWIYSDASAHRIISDLSAFIGYYNSPFRTSHTGGRGLEYVVQQYRSIRSSGADRTGPVPCSRRWITWGPNTPPVADADPIPGHVE